jgi:hypothetical protein
MSKVTAASNWTAGVPLLVQEKLPIKLANFSRNFLPRKRTLSAPASRDKRAVSGGYKTLEKYVLAYLRIEEFELDVGIRSAGDIHLLQLPRLQDRN